MPFRSPRYMIVLLKPVDTIVSTSPSRPALASRRWPAGRSPPNKGMVMAFDWHIDSETRRVSINAEGDFARADVEAYLKAMEACGAVGWSKLIDARFSHGSMSQEDTLALGVLFRGYHVRGPVGPLAIVVSGAQVDHAGRLMGILATADRPMRVFNDLEAARRWLDRQQGG